jgi:hypothetical protein
MLSSCGTLVGGSYVVQEMRDPKTGEKAECIGHIGRGAITPSQTVAMNGCIAIYESHGFRKI